MSAVEYVFVTMLLVNIMLSSVFLVSWLSISRKTYVLLWSLTFGIAAINVLTNAFKATFSSQDVYWIFVNTLSLIVQGLAVAGYRQRSGLSAFPRWAPFYIVIIEATLCYFTVISPHFGIRIAILPISAIFMSLACAYTLVTVPRKLRPAEWSNVGMLCLFGLVQIAVAVVGIANGAERQAEYAALYQQVNFLTMPAAYAGLGTFAVLMLADDLAAKMRSLAFTDDLTKLLNRRGLKEAFTKRLQLPLSQHQSLFIAIADIDNFKTINDNYGHDVGDLTLKKVAKLLELHTPQGTIIGRLGGEEFAIILRADDLPQATAVLERLREEISEQRFTVQDGYLNITASFGVVSYHTDYRNLFDALRVADNLLYQAKNSGRNKVEAKLA